MRIEKSSFGKNWMATAALLLLSMAMFESPVLAQPEPGPESGDIAQIREELVALRAEYEGRLAALEGRLAELEGSSASEARLDAPGADPAAADELASLRDAARQAAGDLTRPEQQPAPPIEIATPGAGNLNRLNPEISFTGIMLGLSSDNEREEFAVEEFELDLQSALDPFSRARVTLAVGHEGVELEEAYVNYSSLPGGLDLLAGKFRQRFGPLNRQHLHALPQSEYPLVYQTLFGEEGLGQTGLSFTWLLPKPWATANEVTFEITDGENEEAFGGENFEDFSLLGRVKNFWEVSDASYFEWGLSGIAGKTASRGASRVYGTDFTWSWQPPGRSKYRGLTWRTELLQSEREDELGIVHEALGGYTYLEGLFRRNLYAGVRLDSVEDPLDPASKSTGVVPYLTWWQSEYVRLRAEYAFFELEPSGESEDRFTLQLTWAAGPHKHESY